jgi:hypothetical protein
VERGEGEGESIREGGRGERGRLRRQRDGEGRRSPGELKCRLILLNISPQLKLHLSKAADFSPV